MTACNICRVDEDEEDDEEYEDGDEEDEEEEGEEAEAAAKEEGEGEEAAAGEEADDDNEDYTDLSKGTFFCADVKANGLPVGPGVPTEVRPFCLITRFPDRSELAYAWFQKRCMLPGVILSHTGKNG